MEIKLFSILQEIINMKTFIFTVFIMSFSATSHAQQKLTHTTKVKFTPPIIVKDKLSKSEKQKRTEKVKFTPPVIVKDSDKKQ